MKPLLDTRFSASLENFFPSRCTIQTPDVTTDVSNQDILTGTGTPVAGLINILCRIGPIIDVRPTDAELRSGEVIEQRKERHCKINGYFPQIQPRVHQAVVDGITFKIRGVESDGSDFSTRLRLEVILP